MNNPSRLIVLIFAIVITFFFSHLEKDEQIIERIKAPSSIGSKEDPLARFNFEINQLVDPKTGKIPDNIHKKEAEFVKSIPTKENIANTDRFRTNTQLWASVGPFNVGGRTRALALDVTDENIIIAGGVSGGMWRSENSGGTWSRSSHPISINSATCVVQDIRQGKENIWYHGTGELRGNSANEISAPYLGDGIFKSTDGGRSWDLLPSTSDGMENRFNSPFNYIWNIALNPTKTEENEIYAAIYGGIVRSQDGGNTWKTVLGEDLINTTAKSDLNNSNAPFYTNIMITPLGILYATLSVFTQSGNKFENKGIFRSIDGENWTNITPPNFAQFHERTVMAYAPSNESVVYFAVDNGNLEIWKFNNLSAVWENLSENVPDFGGDLGSYNSQGGYNMVMAVHPTNEDIVFLGGTNLYRTTDGFSTSVNNSWIGGYDPNGSDNEYDGHHPDQHAIVFYPSNPDKLISANDGGLMTTQDNRADHISWSSLNNGYITSQFYSISVSHEEGSNFIIGGMQDNGTYLKTSSGENQPWKYIFGGDGGFSATTPGRLFWYVSFQESEIYKLTLNDKTNLTSFSRVDPIGGGDYLFINPYILDPNNYNRMYLAGGETVWRNNNLSQIPSGSREPTNVNWDQLAILEPGAQVTALDISTNPANILYIGTNEGNLVKINNANIVSGEASHVFNTSGYIVNITIDPSNADNLFVVNSNYNVKSIFYSSDGGNSFKDVGGNLEEFPNGNGNGPSIRWSEMVRLSDETYKYFVGTSSGLYSTTNLDGVNTVWMREGVESIGNSVVRMIDYRSSDGKIVVATHGNGVFESNLLNTLHIKKPSTEIQSLVVNTSYPNPFSNFIVIEFTIPEEAPLSVIILNASGQLVKTLLNYPQFEGNVSVRWDGSNDLGQPVNEGIYFYRIFYKGKTTVGKALYQNNLR